MTQTFSDTHKSGKSANLVLNFTRALRVINLVQVTGFIGRSKRIDAAVLLQMTTNVGIKIILVYLAFDRHNILTNDYHGKRGLMSLVNPKQRPKISVNSYSG